MKSIYTPVYVWYNLKGIKSWCFEDEASKFLDVMGNEYDVVEFDPDHHLETNHCEW